MSEIAIRTTARPTSASAVRTATDYIMLSGTGRLVAVPWEEAGLRLNFGV